MIPNSLMSDMALPELGRGSQFTLFGFRACAWGPTGCGCLSKAFDDILGHDVAPGILMCFRELAYCLGKDGGRRLKLVAPGCARLTYDEGSVLGAIAASQKQDPHLRDSHLSWLLASRPRSIHSILCDRIGLGLLSANLEVVPPEQCETATRSVGATTSSWLSPVSGNA